MPSSTSSSSGGTRMAYIRASRSHTMCMKTATISPAFSSMKTTISEPPQVALELEVVDEHTTRR